MGKTVKIVGTLCMSVIPAITMAANPASQDWVLRQITLNTSDWYAVCQQGSASSPSGCYGNVASPAFIKLSDRLGGYLTYANINPVNAPGSVFIKAFLGGTNTPAALANILVTVTNSAARCALFTTQGGGLGPQGVSNENPTSGNVSNSLPPPHAPVLTSFNNASTNMAYANSFFIPAAPVVLPAPIYLLCVGYDPANGYTAASIANNVTAV